MRRAFAENHYKFGGPEAQTGFAAVSKLRGPKYRALFSEKVKMKSLSNGRHDRHKPACGSVAAKKNN
ncbi:unnamed protein product [Prunus armeniaca]